MRILELARSAKVAPSAVRYYDRIGLLRPARRDPLTRYRVYDESAVPMLRFIRSAQAFGFSLTEIRSVLRAGRGLATCGRVRDALADKEVELDGKIRELTSLRRTVGELRASCEAALRARRCDDSTICPVLEKRYEGAEHRDAVPRLRGVPDAAGRRTRRRKARSPARGGVLPIRRVREGVE